MKRAGYLKFMTLTAVLLLAVVSRIPALAQKEQTAEKAVIILLDTSGSMKTNDSERLVPDSITQLIYSLPSNYNTAFVCYSTEASLLCGADDMQVMETASSRHRDNIAKLAAEVQYQGYSNAGAGLSRAVDALADTAAEEKYIIMFSDGEILLKEDGDTQESRRLYQDAAKRAADQGITIYTVGLGEEMENPENDIFRAAAMTGGKSWHVAQAAELQEKIDGILAEMGVKQSTVAIVDAGGGQDQAAADLRRPHSKSELLLPGGEREADKRRQIFAVGNRKTHRRTSGDQL
ncbi:MAG: VWA domain-containing protein [Acetatifactor sp.]